MNIVLFEEGFQRLGNPTETITHLVKETEIGILLQNNVRSSVPEIKHVPLYHPKENRIKLNCDCVIKNLIPLQDVEACSETPLEIG